MEELDGKGFVFISIGKPFWCRMVEGQPWLFYWNHDGWVSLKPINGTYVMRAHEYKIPDDQAEIYHEKNRERNV